jgi:Mg/Co/Ni transporter MgtE
MSLGSCYQKLTTTSRHIFFRFLVLMKELLFIILISLTERMTKKIIITIINWSGNSALLESLSNNDLMTITAELPTTTKM